MSPDERDRILVVEDDSGMRRTVERILEPHYDVRLAVDATQAKELLNTEEFQLALVDIQLNEDGDGYHVCRHVKARSAETDVILMTGSITQPDEKLYRSLEEDAFYILFKPFERRVLRALVERCLRLQSERRSKERYAMMLANDLERARGFQRSLLPRRPLEDEVWRLRGTMEPCDALGGDFFFFLRDRGSIVFAISDIVGHGVSAAMYAGMLRSTMDAARRLDPDPEQFLREVLNGIDFFESARYATLFYGQLFPDGRLRYFNAGHPPALWQRGNGELDRLGATGVFLTTTLPECRREVREVTLEPGDRLLTYTDGVPEARDPSDHELGREGLETVFRESCGESCDVVLERLMSRLDEHCGGRPREDDATLLVIERR